MPETIIDLGKRVKAKYPGQYDDLDDAELGRRIKAKFPGQYDDFTDTPSTPQPPTWAERIGATRPEEKAAFDLLEGAKAGFASTVYHGGDILRRLTGAPRIIDLPQVQQAMTPPPTTAGQVGKFTEQAAETVIPGMGLSKGLQGARLGTRIAAEGLLGGTQAGLQSGGDPLATGVGVVTGAGGGYLGGKFQAMRPPTAEKKALDYISDIGGHVSVGTRTGSPFLRAIEKATAFTPGGAFIAGRAEKKTAQALSAEAQRLLEQAHKGLSVTPFEAGTAAREGAEQTVKGYFQRARDSYRMWNEALSNPGNVRRVQTGVKEAVETAPDGSKVVTEAPVFEDIAMPVDIRPLQANMRSLYRKMNEFWTFDEKTRSKGFQALRTLMSSKGVVPAETAESGLSSLKEFVRNNPDDSLAKSLVSQLQNRVDTIAAQAGPDVLTGLREGRKWTAVGEEATEEVLKRLEGKEPKAIFELLTRSGEGGLEYLRRYAKEAPGELTKLGRGYLQKIFDIATEEGGDFSVKRGAKMFNEWRDLAPETKKLLFPNPLMREKADKIFLGMKKLAENPNPSGTATTLLAAGQGGYLLQDPVSLVKYTIGSAALAAALYSPLTSKLLTRAMTTPVVQKARAGGLFRQLARALGTQALSPAAPSPAGTQ